MKIKEGFVLREVSGMNIVMPTGKKVKDFKGAVMLNESGAIIFKRLMSNAASEDLVKALTDVYDIDAAKAQADVQKTIDTFRSLNMIEDTD